MTKRCDRQIGFSEKHGFDCMEQALEVVLRREGFRLEDVLFPDWRFDLCLDDDGRFDVSPGPQPDLFSLFQRRGIGFVVYRSVDEEAALRDIVARTERGEAVPVMVDAFYLYYYSPKNPRHTGHAIVVESYDPKRRTFLVTDPSPWQQFRGEIPVDELLAGMGSQAHGDQGTFTSVCLGFPPRRGLTHADELRQIVHRNASIMRSDAETRHESDPIAVRRFQGFRAIRSLGHAVREWESKPSSWVGQAVDLTCSQLTTVSRRRYGHSQFLISAGMDVGSDVCVQAGRELERIAESWRVPGNLLSRERLPTTFERVATRLHDLADAEMEIIATLESEILQDHLPQPPAQEV